MRNSTLLLVYLLVYLLLQSVIFTGCSPTLKREHISSGEIAAEREKQLEAAFSAEVDQQIRLADVSSPLLAASVELCGDDLIYSRGIGVYQVNDAKENVRKVAQKKLNLASADGFYITHIVSNFPAHKAGLKQGDKINVINGASVKGESLRNVKKAVNFGKPILDVKDPANAVPSYEAGYPMDDRPKTGDFVPRTKPQKVILGIERGGQEMTIEADSVPICGYAVRLAQNDTVNAFADGKNIGVTSGLLRFVSSDTELAMVIGHEIAHNALGHISKKTANTVPGFILDAMASAVGVPTFGTFSRLTGSAFSKEFEAEADYAGIYILARANVDISNAASFWRRMSAEHPSSINSGIMDTHPTTPERFLAIEKHIREIEGKRKSGEPLLPDKK